MIFSLSIMVWNESKLSFGFPWFVALNTFSSFSPFLSGWSFGLVALLVIDMIGICKSMICTDELFIITARLTWSHVSWSIPPVNMVKPICTNPCCPSSSTVQEIQQLLSVEAILLRLPLFVFFLKNSQVKPQLHLKIRGELHKEFYAVLLLNR